jgi:hypothetical protein
VLEWRADPDSGWTNPRLGSFEREAVVFCAHGYSSTFAAATLRELGYAGATDLVGGFEAWVGAGLPVVAATEPDEDAVAGMGGPEAGADVTTSFPGAGRRAGFGYRETVSNRRTPCQPGLLSKSKYFVRSTAISPPSRSRPWIDPLWRRTSW